MTTMISTAALAGLEKLINTALRYDPGTRIALAKLADQVLEVCATAPAAKIYVTADQHGLVLMAHWDGAVQTQLRGTLPALLKLARANHTSFADTGVEVIGSTALLVELQRILKNLDIDWEEALSSVLGDIAGHQSAEWIRSGVGYTRDRARESQRLMGEFLTEELQILPSKNELEGFYQDVDGLRLQADRLETRIKALLKSR